MRDFSEFRRNWRPLLGCFLGMGSALSLNSYILSTFAPYLIEEFGWSRSQWAMLGVVQFLVMICLPIAGRLTDIYGTRRVAAVGALSFPLFLVAFSQVTGDIRIYVAIYVLQTIVCVTATATVYSRVVARAFQVRRGLALAICGSSPPLIGAIGAPLVSAFVAQSGWRAGYLAVAAFCAVSAIATLVLLPTEGPARTSRRTGQTSTAAFAAICRTPAFWILLAATLLANLPFALAHSQIKLVVQEQGLGDATAAMLVSIFAVGSIMGRLVSGAAIDMLPSHLVAAISFALPGLGLMLLVSNWDAAGVVALAILLIGLSFGGEADIVPYLVTRYFPIGLYSTVLGLLSAAMGAAMASGSVLLSYMLSWANSFDPFLAIATVASLAGSLLFFTLGFADVRAMKAGFVRSPMPGLVE